MNKTNLGNARETLLLLLSFVLVREVKGSDGTGGKN